MYSLPFFGTWEWEYPWAFLLLLLYGICKRWCRTEGGALYFPHLALYRKTAAKIHPARYLEPLAVALFVCALASPVIVDRYDPRNRIGFDIVLVLDASRSMSTFGFDPSAGNATRLDAVKTIARDFIARRVNDNIGIVVFGDYAYSAVPPTYEKEIVTDMLDDVEIGIAGDNTAIGDGIATAVKLLSRSTAKTKIILLLTDGIVNRGTVTPDAATAIAARRGIRMYTIGMGNKGEFDAAMLQKLAARTGGESFAANNRDELAAVYATIDTLEKSPVKAKDFPVKSPLYTYPLALGLLAYFAMLHYRRKGMA